MKYSFDLHLEINEIISWFLLSASIFLNVFSLFSQKYKIIIKTIIGRINKSKIDIKIGSKAKDNKTQNITNSIQHIVFIFFKKYLNSPSLQRHDIMKIGPASIMKKGITQINKSTYKKNFKYCKQTFYFLLIWTWKCVAGIPQSL